MLLFNFGASMFKHKILSVIFVLVLLVMTKTAQATVADTHFAKFHPVSGSVAAGSLPESSPFTFSSTSFSQVRIADRISQLKLGEPNSGGWDMITANETGFDAGRYLFIPFETLEAGVQRIDLKTGLTKTLVKPGTQGFTKGDASRWTPWNSYLTAEEFWEKGSTKGRLFELTNPTTATGGGDSNFVHRSIVPRVAHEGLAFDKENNLYFIDEFNGGSIYKYVPASHAATTGNEYFFAGQTFVLQVNGGDNANVVGSFVWIPITNTTGGPIDGISVMNADGTIDGRETAKMVKGTGYQRPEDIEIKTLVNGDEMLFVATTSTHEVYSINLDSNEVNLFVSRNTVDKSTGVSVGTSLANPDNLAIDAAGNIYIVEDQPAGMADIWFARDTDNDGVADSVARWASLSTIGAEATGLYFDKFDANVAYVNVQHPDSLVDSTIMISAIPEPNLASAIPESNLPSELPGSNLSSAMPESMALSVLLSGMGLMGLMGFIVHRRSVNSIS
ncbi:alkaline phosphatase PhoX [Nitrosospira sp. Nsp11]|uniref:alkaline phosphatase PhoX n=1 Tax=Nitrosospira sp. Nsp11 TaxID=1855338 RepID=UPI0021145FCC|nr:alkaline phosphatase PhoX [Nitrosospira sp. Nsp11]